MATKIKWEEKNLKHEVDPHLQIVKEVVYAKTILIAVNAVMAHTKHRE